MKKITLYNKERNKFEEETIPGRHLLNFIYNTKSGLLISEKILKKKFFSHYYGNILKRPGSKKRIADFIHKHKIKLAYLPEFVIKMRAGGKSNVSLQNRIRANNEDRKAWKMNGLKPHFYSLYLKPLRKIIQLFKK